MSIPPPASPGLSPGLLLAAWVPGVQDMLRPGGIQAERIYHLWWFVVAVAAAVFLLVLVALLLATFSRRAELAEAVSAEPGDQRRLARWVGSAVAGTVLLLFVFLIVDFRTARAIGSLASTAEDALVVRVTGHQWWWEVEYLDPRPSRRLTTANEIRIPVGRPVRVVLGSADVIHSLWVPSLHGKRDLIPGHQSETWLRADLPGVYRGQCAEFCGHQHAKMGLLVVAEPADRFAAWYAAQLQPAEAPTDSLRLRGQQAFVGGACALCHTIRGTPAAGTVAPDLTHVGSRLAIAAASLPNTRGHLAAWIVDPQGIKPGAKMPPNPLPAAELQALLAYLEFLR